MKFEHAKYGTADVKWLALGIITFIYRHEAAYLILRVEKSFTKYLKPRYEIYFAYHREQAGSVLNESHAWFIGLWSLPATMLRHQYRSFDGTLMLILSSDYIEIAFGILRWFATAEESQYFAFEPRCRCRYERPTSWMLCAKSWNIFIILIIFGKAKMRQCNMHLTIWIAKPDFLSKYKCIFLAEKMTELILFHALMRAIKNQQWCML